MDDLVVPCNAGTLFSLYPHCLNPINLCQPLYTRPWFYGSCALLDELKNMGATAPPYFDDILMKDDPAGSDDCLENPPGHSVDNIPLRCQNLSGFFAPVIAATGNVPAAVCANAAHEQRKQGVGYLVISPNPAAARVIQVSCPVCMPGKAFFQLADATGKVLAAKTVSSLLFEWDLSGQDIAPGLYFIRGSSDSSIFKGKVIFRTN
jgi:hypothetical protein